MPQKKRPKRIPSAREAQKALRELQKQAKKNGLDKLSDKEIDDIIDEVILAASSRTYRDNPVLVTLKALAQTDVLRPELRAKISGK